MKNEMIQIWIFNIGAERIWSSHLNKRSVNDYVQDKIVNCLDEMLLLMSKSEDILILRNKPDAEFLNYLKEIGIQIPHIFTLEKCNNEEPVSKLIYEDKKLLQSIKITLNNKKACLVPYAITELEEKIAQYLGVPVWGPPSDVAQLVNNKKYTRDIATKLGFPVTEGKVCINKNEVLMECDRLRAAGFDEVIVKELCNASGKGMYKVENEKRLERILKWYYANDESGYELLVEGWINTKRDFNFQIVIHIDGTIEYLGVSEQIMDHLVYVGSKFYPASGDIDKYEDYAKLVGKYSFSIGYIGYVNIDSIVDEENELIIPMIEINGRFSLSTYPGNIVKKSRKLCHMSYYLNLCLKTEVTSNRLLAKLYEEGLLAKNICAEGIILYTSQSLPSKKFYSNSLFMGRLFVLLNGNTWSDIERYKERLNELIIHNDDRS